MTMSSSSSSSAVAMMVWMAVVGVIVQQPVGVAGQGIDYSAWKPCSTCTPQGGRCYLVTPDETTNRFDKCCNGPNGVKMSCKGSKWWATCQQDSSNLPALDPKGPDYGLIAVTDAYAAGNQNCPDQMNLGPYLSKSTCYAQTFPKLGSPPGGLAYGSGAEYEVGFLVGGNYTSVVAAEIEGNIVVLGDFNIGPNGIKSIGT